ncbi:MAG: hypothetical protein HRF52_11655 [Ignavibacterium sp.]|jgi:uncharacterized protein involved in exopolysaccharide biosynthesis|uniref:GumC family protein n=1 Tax=Ignavibacterium sp. TaxID=2651167 RepID=UPI00329745FE
MIEENRSEKSNRFEDLLIIILKYKRIIILNVTIVTIAAIIISLILPNKYTAQASFIAPKKKGGLFGDIAGFSSTISNISKVLGGRLGTVTEDAYNYLVILQSRTAALRVIEKFDLRNVYEIDADKPIEDILDELDNNVKFNVEDEGNIVISVTDKSPKRASDIANFYVQILNEMSIDLAVKEAKNNREFIEKRFFEIQDTIKFLEDSLKKFSKNFNVLELQEQVKGAITVAAQLKAEVELAKMERDLLKNNLGESHPLVLQADLKLKDLNKRLSTMKFGEDSNLKSSINFFIPFEKIPETGVLYLRLMRDYEIQNKLLEFIYPIYEQAKIEEQKNIPVVVVVDQAIPPEKKSSPKRTLIVVASLLMSFFISTGYVLIKNSFDQIKNDEDRYNKIKIGILDHFKIKRK